MFELNYLSISFESVDKIKRFREKIAGRND
jgi:hypothetical protein